MIVVKSKSPDLRWLSEKIEEGKIATVLDKVYDFDRIGEAQSYIESKRARGKVVLTVS